MVHRNRPLRFACTGCGQCCSGPAAGYVIAVDLGEQRRMQEYLGVSWRWFRRRYLFRYDVETESLRMRRGRCVFLGPDNRCRVYPVRPVQCRTYPFWPELLADGRTWRAERRRCEGIERGAVVPLARIERALKQLR